MGLGKKYSRGTRLELEVVGVFQGRGDVVSTQAEVGGRGSRG